MLSRPIAVQLIMFDESGLGKGVEGEAGAYKLACAPGSTSISLGRSTRRTRS